MKKALVAIASLLVSLSAYAQGQVNFKTHITSDVPPIDAKILNLDGTAGAGAFAQLGIVGAGGSFTPMFEAPGVVNAAGYVSAGAATFTGVAGGTAVQLAMRAWVGASWDTATARGQSANPITVTLVEAPGTPNDLTGLTGFTLVPTPEPTTLALGALGLGALLVYRRKV